MRAEDTSTYPGFREEGEGAEGEQSRSPTASAGRAPGGRLCSQPPNTVTRTAGSLGLD